ncbi:DMT family transporter [Pseudomonas sp. GX19020]|uniref:DMT family transporter n=1 Tax=Pseudomonas sp. GX19020 TaxID=2942277 RepID=UPI00201A0C7F|nr:DMT family transporter [Pseudomonas sp. GX19020]MCL4067772.1 DMT family transporter [Pseudomonas sp. GX19020]
MWNRQADRPVAGIIWMLVSGIAMVGVNGAVKYVGTSLPATQSAFLRFAVGLVFFLPMLPAILRAGYPARVWQLFGYRGIFHVGAVILWFYAMARIPVAEVSAIGFLNPVIVLIVGGLLLGEGLSLRRILVALVAFAGALIVLRPGLREIAMGHWAQLGAAFLFAGGYVIAKRLSALAPAGVIVAMMTYTSAIGLLPLALIDWQPVALWQIAALALGAGFATLGHYAMTRAFAAAPLAVTQPVSFLQIIWAALMGAVFFHEGIDPFVILGGAVIIGAISFNIRAEANARRVIRAADGAGTSGPAT